MFWAKFVVLEKICCDQAQCRCVSPSAIFRIFIRIKWEFTNHVTSCFCFYDPHDEDKEDDRKNSKRSITSANFLLEYWQEASGSRKLFPSIISIQLDRDKQSTISHSFRLFFHNMDGNPSMCFEYLLYTVWCTMGLSIPNPACAFGLSGLEFFFHSTNSRLVEAMETAPLENLKR